MTAAANKSSIEISSKGDLPPFVVMEDSSASTRSNTPSSKQSTPNATGSTPLASSKMANLRGSSNLKKHKADLRPKPTTIIPSGGSSQSSTDKTTHLVKEENLDREDRKNAKNHPPPSRRVPAVNISDHPVSKRQDEFLQYSTTGSTNPLQEDSELVRLKKELDAAKSRIARQDEELSKARAVNTAPSSHMINSMQDAYNAQRPQNSAQDDARSDVSDCLSSTSLQSRGPGGFLPTATVGPYGQVMPAPVMWNQVSQRPFANRAVPPAIQPLSFAQGVRAYGSQISPISPDSLASMSGFGYGLGNHRAGSRSSRTHPNYNSAGSWATCGGEDWSPVSMTGAISPQQSGSITPVQSPLNVFPGSVGAYQPRPVGAPLSATAADFSTAGGAQWANRSSSPNRQVYIDATEPLNYRRMLDKNTTCDWKYITDKIVQHQDQQASIFLQQKLKAATVQQKYEIVQSIIAQAYPLMVNRFGNFLIQRCFEHGTPDQVVAIAEAIRGKTVLLSMDAFGCHVVQKAFDAVPEEYKAIMVHELLRCIPETVIHRYACHVWQKLFELRWSDSPPQIMKYVNEALKGMWHEVALGETGSLVVQNIFENCLEEDKRPCINEVLNSIDIVAHGQFGNWCIQHICEHGAPTDRTRAVDHVLKYATEYSMDQFASKVVEKCLKIGGTEFLDRYLSRVCEGRPDRPRIPLIDIASDQYGNYLIQYILTHAGTQHRELVASHIRKHMVSLRGSKFGSRVGMLCSNPTYATRPGVGMGTQAQRFPGAASGSGFNSAAQVTTSGVPSTAPFTGSNVDGAANFPPGFH